MTFLEATGVYPTGSTWYDPSGDVVIRVTGFDFENQYFNLVDICNGDLRRYPLIAMLRAPAMKRLWGESKLLSETMKGTVRTHLWKDGKPCHARI